MKPVEYYFYLRRQGKTPRQACWETMSYTNYYNVKDFYRRRGIILRVLYKIDGGFYND